MSKKSKVTDQTATGQAGIRKKSKVPGVMITQFMEELPEGMTTPDFTRKPIALTIQEGKFAFFKAIIVGTPTPTVTWSRANGEILFHPSVCLQKYDEATHEHTIEFPKVSPEDADTYKCFATNEYGRAVCTVVLNVIEVGFSKTKELQKAQVEDTVDFRKTLKKRNPDGTREQKPMETEEKVWEILLSADKKDYERICAEYGITNFRGMLKKLNEMKKEREEEVAEFVTHISSLKPIEVTDDDYATIELDMDLKDPSSKLYLYKDGVMVPFSKDEADEQKHSLKQVGKKYIFKIKKLGVEDAGLYSVDVEGVNVFSTDFKVTPVEFAVKIQEVKAEEREDALFQCVLTAPMNEIKWYGKSALLSNSEKHEITISEDKLIHKLIVRDCMPLDAGIYAAVAGIKSCNAWLIVEADKDPASKGKKVARKTTMAGGSNEEELLKIAKEQQEKYQKELEEKLELAKKAQAEKEAAGAAAQEDEEAAKKAAAEAKAKAKAAARAKRAAAGKDGAPRKSAKKGAGAGSGAASADGTVGAEGAAGVGGAAGADGTVGAGGAAGVGGAAGAGGADGTVGAGGAGGAVGAGGAAGAGGTGGPGGAAAVAGAGGTSGIGAGSAGGAGNGVDGGASAGGQEGGHGAAAIGKGGAQGAAGVGVGGGEGEDEYDSFEDSDEEFEGEWGEEGCVEGGGEEGEGGEGGEGGVGGEGGGKGGKRRKRVRAGPLVPDTVIDPGVHFHAGLSDCKAIIGEAAELECKVSSEDCVGVWYKDGEEIKSSEGLTISKDGTFHRLKIHKVTEEFAGKYKFEADGRKTEAEIAVEDPPRFNAEDLEAFKTPVTVKKGHKATFNLAFIGREPIKIQWYREGEELSEEANIKIEHSEGSSRLLLLKLQRKDSGEIKIKLKNEFGTMEALSQLVVLDKPTPPMGPLEIVEASSSAVEFKWRPPKDSGGCKILNYILERQQVGRNTWKKLGPIGPEAKYRDTDVDHGRRYCYRLRVETEMGISELMETEDIQAGTKAYPGPPSAPKVVSAFKDCITLSWSPPADTGGTSILGYNLEKRKKGSNLWGPVNPPNEMIRGKQFAVKDVIEGMEYEFRVSAINNSGAGEFSSPSEFVFARDPKKPPGKVSDFKVTDSTYTTISLSWTKPKDIEGVEDEAKGYFVEIRLAENTEWDRCNLNAITMTSYTVKGMKSMAMYWVRVIAINEGGHGEPQELDNYHISMPPPVRPRFTDAKIKSFMVVRAGNSARFNINFEASPWPDVIWLKDGVPVSKKVTISNAEGTSQILIPSAERSDTGVYTIIVKNIVGQETISIEIRVTDEPKPPGPVELDENVHGTVTISWTASPDEKRDDRLHYMVTKRDSSKRTWNTIADRIFNNRFTACNIMPGREYQFRVYAKNDMGSSKPSESPKWLIPAKKEKFTVKMPESKTCNLLCPPKFIVPLKTHTAPEGYECYMTCAIKGDPTPHVTWLRDSVSLNTNTNYLISNTCGVCSLLILRVGSKDTGEYKVVAENSLGRAESATKLTVRE
ncbi:immunoglobulin-like and fibronectin type III domain-containing protein 1.1 isoform X1 [Maylandia zebra]|uniref:immunoglobulin-like and fibronectin type III domain-containing protein 1.1 isoform X1 n=2 Tax=Maylandia zebra TaxID=106582 RepID=UPI00403C6479